VTPAPKWHFLLCFLSVAGCAEPSAPDAAEQARMSRAMAKMEAGQARSDVAALAASAKANTEAESARRKAAGSKGAE
jgi:hypothetical protein